MERGDGVKARFERLRERFRDDADETAEKSDWKRYGSLLQVAVVLVAAFSGAIASTASTGARGSSGPAGRPCSIPSGRPWSA